MEEKKYLKWYNKVGYGTGDLAGNVVYAFLSSFVMLYLTNTVGLNPGVVGTLIMVSKLFDGVSDMFFGTLIDKEQTWKSKTVDALCIYWLCGNACGELCNTGKSWKNSTVCMVFSCIYFAECSIFYCKQYCLCITGYVLYKK